MLPKLQELVLLAVQKLGPECTVAEIRKVLTSARNSEQTFSPLLTTLDRITAKKLVTWRRGDPEPRVGGRAPRLYTITDFGRTTLSTSLNMMDAIQSAPCAPQQTSF